MKKKTRQEMLNDAVAEAQAPKLPEPDLSLGCDLLDLAVGGKIGKAVGPGRYIWLQGDSGSGKSYIATSILAEAAKNPNYANHKLVYIDKELGATFDLEEFFGPSTASRIERPDDIPSLEAFYDYMTKLGRATPYVAVLDSWDALLPEAQIKAIEKAMKDRESGKQVDGSYQMDHAKIHSTRLRNLVTELGASGSIFLGISQNRDNVNAGLFDPKKKTSGGRALRFWSSVEIELSSGGKIEKEIRGKKRQVGTYFHAKVVKNRINGKTRAVDMVFMPDVGICNTSTSVEWLRDEKYLNVINGRIESPWLDHTCYQEDFIKKIEQNDLEPKLAELLQESWDDLESLISVDRKRRYA